LRGDEAAKGHILSRGQRGLRQEKGRKRKLRPWTHDTTPADSKQTSGSRERGRVRTAGRTKNHSGAGETSWRELTGLWGLKPLRGTKDLSVAKAKNAKGKQEKLKEKKATTQAGEGG